MRTRVLEVAVPVAIARGQAKEAESLADEMIAMSRNRARTPSISLDVGEAYLDKARALAAEGRATEAQDAARQARPVLAAALGDANAWTREAEQLAGGTPVASQAPRPSVCEVAQAAL